MTTTYRVRWLPWVLLVVTAVTAAMEFIVNIQNNTNAGHRLQVFDVIAATVFFLLPLAFAGIGTLILTRRPGNRIGWLMIAVGLGFAMSALSTDYPILDPRTHQPLRPFAPAVGWVQAWDWELQLVALLLLLLLFPTARLASARWKFVMWIGIVALLGYGGVGAVKRGRIENLSLDNPYGIVWVPDVVIGMLEFFAVVALAAAALSLVLRFRTAQGEIRQQLKWFTYGASVAITLNIATVFFGWDSIVGAAAIAAEIALPICMGFAILRYRLYDIDVLINRTLVYGALTITLAGLYLGSVIGLQALFRVLVGQGSDLAVALSTLAVAALFNPWRRRLQAFIDRRFYRWKYDAARTLTAFQARLRNEVNLDELTADLLGVVYETMQPAQVSLWLRGERES